MRLKEWVISYLHDNDKDAELTERERRTDALVQALQREQERNGLGFLFDAAIRPTQPRRGEH